MFKLPRGLAVCVKQAASLLHLPGYVGCCSDQCIQSALTSSVVLEAKLLFFSRRNLYRENVQKTG